MQFLSRFGLRLPSTSILAQPLFRSLFPASSYPRKGLCVLFNCFGDNATVNELAFAAALDQIGFDEDFEVMRNGGWRDALQCHDLTAIHVNLRGDSLKNHQPRFVG